MTGPAPVVVAGLVAGLVVSTGATWFQLSRWVATNRVLARLEIDPSGPGDLPDPLRRALNSAGVTTDHRLLVHGWAAAVALAAVAAATTGGGPVLLALALAGPPGTVFALRGRAARQRIRQIPLALDAVAAGLRGGSSLRDAIADAADGIGGALGAELRIVVTNAAAGLPLAEVLATWIEAADDAASRLAGASLVVAAELGGPGADAVDAAAASLRDRAAADDEVAALSVQARLSAMLLAAAPIGFAFLLTSLDPSSARFLLRTPAGWVCIVAGLTLDAIGAAWMSKLVRGAR